MNDWNVTEEGLKKQGIAYQSGRWTDEEIKILQMNIDDYKKHYDIENFFDLVIDKDNDIGEGIFWIQLRKNINRPMRAVKHKVLQLFSEQDDEIVYGGKFIKNEIKALHSLQKHYSNGWVQIGKAAGRAPTNLRCRYLDSKCLPYFQKRDDQGSSKKDIKILNQFSGVDKKLKKIVFEVVYTGDGYVDFSKINWQVVSWHMSDCGL